MTPRALPVAASVAYAANCALGLAVAARLIDTHEIRGVHHALFTVTTALTGASAAAPCRIMRGKDGLMFHCLQDAGIGVLNGHQITRGKSIRAKRPNGLKNADIRN